MLLYALVPVLLDGSLRAVETLVDYSTFLLMLGVGWVFAAPIALAVTFHKDARNPLLPTFSILLGIANLVAAVVAIQRSLLPYAWPAFYLVPATISGGLGLWATWAGIRTLHRIAILGFRPTCTTCGGRNLLLANVARGENTDGTANQEDWRCKSCGHVTTVQRT